MSALDPDRDEARAEAEHAERIGQRGGERDDPFRRGGKRDAANFNRKASLLSGSGSAAGGGREEDEENGERNRRETQVLHMGSLHQMPGMAPGKNDRLTIACFYCKGGNFLCQIDQCRDGADFLRRGPAQSLRTMIFLYASRAGVQESRPPAEAPKKARMEMSRGALHGGKLFRSES